MGYDNELQNEREGQHHDEPPAPRAGERDDTDSLKSLSALLKDPSYMTLPRARQIAIKHAHWNATTLPNNEFSLSWQDTKVLLDENATLVAQRERLVDFVRPFAEKGCVCMGDTCKQRRLPKFCTPCRASELLATIEREGV